ncbi:hypothetical protein BSL78_20488 [Apostichopus japonicus]|uniref:Uncharacterized protein n=1 Tax=Stichopus japonicus TaxID=307972 RepID=A0A2G8K3S5_STIJA|nr:hypothetical protein BSL78_20488 [Apostichopus japonicus]
METFDLRKGPWILLILVVLLSSICDWTDGKVAYQFKQHYYRKKPKVEKRFKLARKLCLDTEACRNLHGQDLSKCLRQCLAPSCYEEIYGDDEI